MDVLAGNLAIAYIGNGGGTARSLYAGTNVFSNSVIYYDARERWKDSESTYSAPVFKNYGAIAV